MRVFRHFLASYPRRTGTMLACLLLAAALDGLGVSTLLPVLALATSAGADTPDVSNLRALETATAPETATALETALDRAFASAGLEPSLGALLVLVAIAFWLKAGLSLLANWQVGATVARVATDLRLGLLRALLGARWAWFTRQPRGAVANAMATEAARASESYRHMALVLAFAIESVVYAAIALAISWAATLAAIGAAALTLAALGRFVRMSSEAGAQQTRLLRSLLARLSDTLGAARLLKATARESAVGPLLEADTEALDRTMRRRVFGREALRALQEPILLTFGCVGLFVAFTILKLPMAQIVVLVLVFARLLARVSSVQTKAQLMLMESSALWSLLALTEEAKAEREEGGGHERPTLDRGIALRDVRVEREGRTVLEEVDLSIAAGEITALEGASGAGKTTLADLLTGLVAPDAGSVEIDGIDLERLDRRRWRSRIGAVPQDTVLFHDTVRANVTLGDPLLDDAAVERALRSADAWDFVEHLPGGLDASVGEHGALLSGGQCQRIAIARALVRDPWLLVLDEATAGLDAESEATVWKAVAALRGRVTVLAISHGPAAARVADRVWRLEDGRVRARPRQVA